MEIEEKAIYDEMANYVGNGDAWDEALKDWVKIPDGIYHDNGNNFTGELHCDDEEPKEWRIYEENHLDGNISADNWAATNHKKVNLSLYVVNAVKGHMVESIDELN